MSDVYHRATKNIGNPPHAEAYCRVLAMEVEDIVRRDIAKKLCEHCARGVGKDIDGDHVEDHLVAPCKARMTLGDRY